MFMRTSLVVVPVWLSLARVAGACEADPCPEAVAVVGLAPASAAPVPTDGVLVLRAETIGAPDGEALLGRLALTVTLDDAAVAGALHATDFADVLIWRPALPLTPGASYAVRGDVVNPGADGLCGEAMQTLEFSFTAADGPAAALVPGTLTVKADYVDAPVLTLTTLVCCDDAYPGDQSMCGVSYGATWTRGKCTATQTRGSLQLQLTGAPGAEASSAGQWARVLLQDGEVVAGGLATTFQLEVEAPACFRVDQVSLATGAVATGAEQCVGEAEQERLGVRALDPAEALDGRCVSDLYTCEIEDGRWDVMRCESWGLDAVPPPVAPLPEEGCGCRGGAGGAGPLWLMLLAWGAGARRRRARPVADSLAQIFRGR